MYRGNYKSSIHSFIQQIYQNTKYVPNYEQDKHSLCLYGAYMQCEEC